MKLAAFAENLSGVTKAITEERTRTGSGLTGPRIRCPLCEWEPPAGEVWECTCGHQWHAFDTGGVCPGCIKQWMSTQCHQCKGWSVHSDWYVY